MKTLLVSWLVVIAASVAAAAAERQATIHVDTTRPGRPVSRFLTGACIEDVNHEVYGGIYSQMIFGESFQEPPSPEPVKGFWSTDGSWRVADGEVHGDAGAGPKLISRFRPFAEGEAGVEVHLGADAGGGGNRNAGLIVAVGESAGAGADNFAGYEVSLDAGRKRLIVGRHQRDFRPLREAACEVPVDRWVTLAVRITGGKLEVFVDGKSIAQIADDRPLPAGTVGLRQWQRPARYRKLWVKPSGGARTDLPFEPPAANAVVISRMWGPVATGTAVLEASLDTKQPFTGAQSQRITFARGEGEAGIENQGLNRWGMSFVQSKPYDGYVWLRAEKPLTVYAGIESRDGSRTYARAPLAVSGGDWARYDFTLTPEATDPAGRFSLRLTSHGSVTVGHAFLQPGEWGRFKGLPVRRDVAEGLIDQGVTALRYGGLMANAPEYRWKKMIGPRDRRPPYRGFWYPHSSNGWGIIEFLDLCQASGFLAIPNFNMDQTPRDMADFMEYVNGPAASEWGRRRAADGHPAPYNLRHVQLGNEEKVDEAYYRTFEPLAKAIWAKDPGVILVVGDFQYERPITDPMRVAGVASGITSLAAHKKILDLAKQHDREVWFDVHVWTEGPTAAPSARALTSYVNAIERLAEGAKHRVVVLEFNANNHDHRRALANAAVIGQITRDGRVPVALSANCLQPDGQNDNGWDQGLLFLNPAKVWLQPPGYVTRMVSTNYQPRVLDARVEGAGAGLDVTVTGSEDRRQLVLHVVNLAAEARPVDIRLDGFTPASPVVRAEQLAAPLRATNTAEEPDRVAPKSTEWRHGMKDGAAAFEFPPHSFTVIRFE